MDEGPIVTTLLVLAMVVIVATLIWSWWSGRLGRDPASTVDHFHRALTAMSPEERREAARDSRSTDDDAGDDPQQGDTGEPDRG